MRDASCFWCGINQPVTKNLSFWLFIRVTLKYITILLSNSIMSYFSDKCITSHEIYKYLNQNFFLLKIFQVRANSFLDSLLLTI